MLLPAPAVLSYACQLDLLVHLPRPMLQYSIVAAKPGLYTLDEVAEKIKK
jgi:hypothetical protein